MRDTAVCHEESRDREERGCEGTRRCRRRRERRRQTLARSPDHGPVSWTRRETRPDRWSWGVVVGLSMQPHRPRYRGPYASAPYRSAGTRSRAVSFISTEHLAGTSDRTHRSPNSTFHGVFPRSVHGLSTDGSPQDVIRQNGPSTRLVTACPYLWPILVTRAAIRGRRARALSGVAGGDDPGAGVEEDAGTGVVCVEGGAQSVAGVLGGGGVEAIEEVAGVEKAEHVLVGGGGVGAVVDGFVDVGEVDLVESGCGQDALACQTDRRGRTVPGRARSAWPGPNPRAPGGWR